MPCAKSPRMWAAVVIFSLGTAMTAQAGWFDWWSRNEETTPGNRQKFHSGKRWPLEPRSCEKPEPFMHRYHTAHYWPDPYRWEDRNGVRAHLNASVEQGWMTATTLFDQHFDPATQEINLAGKTHLKWILFHCPPNHRTVWVQAADSVEVSQARQTSVQAEAARMVGADCPGIMLRVCQPAGMSAQEADLIRRGYLSSQPPPRVPYNSLSSGGSGGGSGSAAPSTGN